ncbi:Gp138 family membrane-puncturing spike protein [Pseudomonas aeruginosa]|nr:Gp138 family membrane-puncturing spike protein [Pseudomonas aeruginosa]MDF5860940.1 Gp138 family membrane-puncturing spike protein [Pseudomonas aeruginosa]MDF5924399.1 Gp138 family membrane-puncturing spike protein [Pseudomonas aeruginosa]
MVGINSQGNDYLLEQLKTCMPARVLRVASQEELRVDVQPVIDILRKDGDSQPIPTILNVPVLMLGGSKSLISYPVEAGDFVMLVFSQLDIDRFIEGTGSNAHEKAPYTARRFHLQDAVAIPGLFPFGAKANSPDTRTNPHNPQDLVVTHNKGTGNEVEVRLGKDGSLTLKSPLAVNVESPSVSVKTQTLKVEAANTTWTGNITHSGNYVQTGESTFNGIQFSTHKHGGVMPGGGTTSVPQP